MIWLEKYKPKTLNDVIGDKHEILKIEQFINQFTKKNRSKSDDQNDIIKPCIIISGSNGVGKSLITEIVLKTNNIEKIVPDFTNISVTKRSKKKKQAEKDVINSNRSILTYYRILSGGRQLTLNGTFNNSKIALVIDDDSNISNPKEKEAVKALIKLNNRLKEFPIIIITGTKHSKFINELRKIIAYPLQNEIEPKSSSKTSKKKTTVSKKKRKKYLNEIVLRKPPYNDLCNFINKICSSEQINIAPRKSLADDIMFNIVEHAQYDIRRLINILEELKSIYKNRTITYEIFKQYCETSKTKDVDHGIYEATEILLNNYTDINNAQLLYSEDRSTIPLMVHENYPDNLKNQYPKMSIKSKINIICNISKSISESDKVDGLIYSNQCWNLQSVHGFYSCVLPSYYANMTKNKMMKSEYYNYTRDYNRTSIKKINNKAIKKAQEHYGLKQKSVYDFFYISSILKTLLEKQELELIAYYMKPYGLNYKETLSIIKIDKTNDNKPIVTGKTATTLEHLINNKSK